MANGRGVGRGGGRRCPPSFSEFIRGAHLHGVEVGSGCWGGGEGMGVMAGAMFPSEAMGTVEGLWGAVPAPITPSLVPMGHGAPQCRPLCCRTRAQGHRQRGQAGSWGHKPSRWYLERPWQWW